MEIEKKEFRKNIVSMRETLAPEYCSRNSHLILEKLFKSDFYKQAETVLTYVSYRNEADTMALIDQALADGKRVGVPKTKGRLNMVFSEITTPDTLASGAYGILEPVTETPISLMNSLVIVPGTAFDRDKNRMGYGSGYYDAFLSVFQKPYHLTTCGLAYSFQVFDHIINEPHDIKLDWIITPEGIL